MTLTRDGFTEASTIDIREMFTQMRVALHEESNKELDEQISIGNNVYTVAIDGRAASGRSAIQSALKSVRLNFPLVAVDVALAVMKRELENAIRKTTKTRTGKLFSSVRLWYGGNDKPIREVTSTAEIAEFVPGDFVVMYPVIEYGVYVNTAVSQATGTGFMGRAAKRIRSIIRQKKTSAGLSIYIQHSMRIAKIVGGDAAQAKYGVPVMYVKWKKSEFRTIGV